MIIDPTTLEARHRYRLLISTVAPRPIAWVSTRARDGSHNLAPFSFFQALCGTPPLVMISVGRRRGAPKDTLRNIQETGEFVINMVTEPLARPMNLTSGEYGPEVDEFAVAGLTPVPSDIVGAPRVGESPVNLEAKLSQVVPLDGSEYSIVIGQIVRWHIADGLLAPDGLIDIARIRPIARLARDEYVTFGEVFEMIRPVVQ
jgi:flavin reductase (DIM6/NTAB) family NADH-FMN oxidoreductase RutF